VAFCGRFRVFQAGLKVLVLYKQRYIIFWIIAVFLISFLSELGFFLSELGFLGFSGFKDLRI